MVGGIFHHSVGVSVERNRQNGNPNLTPSSSVNSVRTGFAKQARGDLADQGMHFSESRSRRKLPVLIQTSESHPWQLGPVYVGTRYCSMCISKHKMATTGNR